MEIIMWMPTVVAIVALVATIVFGVINARTSARSAAQAERSADSAEKSLGLAQRQLENSVRAHEESTQPYIWADLRAREDGSGMMQFVVGNSGPTVATDVRIGFLPALNHLVPHGQVPEAYLIEKLLRDGLKSLPPGRVFAWNLGMASSYYSEEDDKAPATELSLTINARGPHGDLATSSYSISLIDLRDQALRPVGFGMVEKPLVAISSQLSQIRKAMT